MIYLDNSATTFPKPVSVKNSMSSAFVSGANPGRSGHRLSMKASEDIYSVRKLAAEFFNARSEADVVFTLNCTAALNIVIKGILHKGDHAVVSSLEHNAVMRPLNKLAQDGVTYSTARVYPGDDNKTIASFRECINERTKMIICTQASNVWGIRLPVERISALAHEYGLLFAADAAQSAGVIPIDLQRSGIDYLCLAGHKGLYGPMGTGMLIVNTDVLPDSLIEGGTGSNSLIYEQPSELPDRFESGTPNYYGIAALGTGIKFVSDNKPENIAAHEFRLIRRLYRGLSSTAGIKLYLPEPDPDYYVPILSFNIEGMDSETAAQRLNALGIAVRAGLHCSPAAHRMMGTESTGAVRVSPSFFTKSSDIDAFLRGVRKISVSKI